MTLAIAHEVGLSKSSSRLTRSEYGPLLGICEILAITIGWRQCRSEQRSAPIERMVSKIFKGKDQHCNSVAKRKLPRTFNRRKEAEEYQKTSSNCIGERRSYSKVSKHIAQTYLAETVPHTLVGAMVPYGWCRLPQMKLFSYNFLRTLNLDVSEFLHMHLQHSR